MPRDPIPTWCFALAVVRLGRRFLVVREKSDEWYLPAGRVEPGETYAEAARRETMEEAGVPIVLEGVIRIEHTPRGDTARSRVIFTARPADDTPPRETPDDETLGARWVTIEELAGLRMRSPEVRQLFEHVARGGVVCPLSVLEETPFRDGS